MKTNINYSLARMPPPDIYEAEIEAWPWSTLIRHAAAMLTKRLHNKATLIDYMCGTGQLLNLLPSAIRKRSVGVDSNLSYVRYGRNNYQLNLVVSDALRYKPQQRVDAISCTAGIHHLPRKQQLDFLEKMHDELNDDGILLIGEELLPAFRNERERRRAAIKLFSSIMDPVLEKHPKHDVILASLSVLENDLLERGEWKLSIDSLRRMLSPRFEVVIEKRIWPNKPASYGDWLFLCKKIPSSH
jgi:SAM-dependent methyltransferase